MGRADPKGPDQGLYSASPATTGSLLRHSPETDMDHGGRGNPGSPGHILTLLYLEDGQHIFLDSLAQCRRPSLQSLSCKWSHDLGSCKSQNFANLHKEWKLRLLEEKVKTFVSHAVQIIL